MKEKLSDYGINGDDNSKEYSNPKTAVEYLKEHFQTLINNDERGLYKLLFEQAKEMEKEQIIDAVIYGNTKPSMVSSKILGEQYYNETFKSE